ncbi:MAG: DUF1326 domain-containing protein [Actinomycetota bacterium]
MAEAWRINGTVLIACNCDWGCPCNVNARPTQGYCEGGWTWVTDEGRIGDVAIDGLSVSVFCKWPGAIHEGNGTAISFIDERADETQREALTRLVRGQVGGPWEVFINTYTLAGPEPAHYELTLDDYATTLRIGDTVHLELTPMSNPVTGAEAHSELHMPEALVVKRAVLATNKTFRVTDPAIDYDYSGRYSAFGRFEYQSS